jgi:hypothetical protein
MIRQAISPRLAISTFFSMLSSKVGNYRLELDVGWVKPPCATQHSRVVLTQRNIFPWMSGRAKSLTRPTSNKGR